MPEKYECEICEPPTDVTDQVLAERDDQMAVLRTRSRAGQKWSVVVTCPAGHEIKVTGVWA